MGWGGPQQWNQHVPPEGGFDEVQVHYTTPPPPEPVVPQGRDGFVRISHRIFVVPEGTAPSAVVEELNDVHNMGVSEKHGMPLDPTGWDDENTFANAINKALRVKGGKAGPKFWKGVREAGMKLCGTQDLLLLISAVAEPPGEQAQALCKNLFGAADTKAVADQLVGLKSGKVVTVLIGWDAEEVRSWPLVSEDPIPAAPSREELARRHDPDDLSQYYSHYSRQAPPRQVPPRQRGQYGGPPMGGPPRWGANGMGGMGHGQYGNSPRAWNGEQQQQQQHWNGGGYGDMQQQQHQQHPQQQQWNNGSYGGGYGNGGGDGQSGGYGGGQQGNYGVHQPYSGHGMQQPSNPILGQQSSGGLGHLNGYGGSQSQQPGGGHGLGLNGFGGGQLPGMGGFDGQQQSQHQQAHVPQPPQHAPQPPQHPPQQQQMGGMGGYANGLSSRLGGGGLGGGGMSVLRASDDASLPAGLAAASSQFGMSANAPSFTPGGSGGGGCGCGGLGGSLGGGGGGSASFEQESLRAAAENLWAGTSAAAPSSRSFPGSSFTVPDLNKVPSLNAIEAESMRAAAAGLWDQGSGGSAAAPSADSLLGMPPLPSGMLGGCGAAASDEIGLCGADLLAGLRLDGGSEPSMR